MKLYRFYYHWNKPENKWSIHFRGKCYRVDHLECDAKTESKSNKRQPVRVMQGFTHTVGIGTNADGTKYGVIWR